MRLTRSLLVVAHLSAASVVVGFTVCPRWDHHHHHRRRRRRRLRGRSAAAMASGEPAATATAPTVIGVVAPLLYRGPYACLGLQFPHLRNETSSEDGVSLEFVLDTGANVNTLHSSLVEALRLPQLEPGRDWHVVGRAGVGGAFEPGDRNLYLLGDCRLAGMPPGVPQHTFMTNLSAASLPLAGPAGAGLLGLTFLASFRGGVEFDWSGTDGDPPTLMFYFYDLPPAAAANATRVPLDLTWLVPALDVTIGGEPLRAILDTGSPFTILSPEAARQAGITTVAAPATAKTPDPPRRPPAVGDEVLTIGGVDGTPLRLRRSQSTSIPVAAGGASLGVGPVYVGDLPLFAMLRSRRFPFNVSGTAEPSVILGLDALRRTHRMIFRFATNEVWFDELRSDQQVCKV